MSPEQLAYIWENTISLEEFMQADWVKSLFPNGAPDTNDEPINYDDPQAIYPAMPRA